MSLHKIKYITEAVFGCKEHLDGPHVVLVFTHVLWYKDNTYNQMIGYRRIVCRSTGDRRCFICRPPIG